MVLGTEGKKETDCASMFMVAVVKVPGRVPLIVTVPTASCELSHNPTECETCAAVNKLIDDVVLKGAGDVAREIRKSLHPEVPRELESTATAAVNVCSN